jgi:hypothetical protein
MKKPKKWAVTECSKILILRNDKKKGSREGREGDEGGVGFGSAVVLADELAVVVMAIVLNARIFSRVFARSTGIFATFWNVNFNKDNRKARRGNYEINGARMNELGGSLNLEVGWNRSADFDNLRRLEAVQSSPLRTVILCIRSVLLIAVNSKIRRLRPTTVGVVMMAAWESRCLPKSIEDWFQNDIRGSVVALKQNIRQNKCVPIDFMLRIHIVPL